MSVLFADGFDAAFIGLGSQFSNTVAVYDYEKCVDALMKGSMMSRETAEEWMEHNVTGSYVGENTPVFLQRMTIKEARELCHEDD